MTRRTGGPPGVSGRAVPRLVEVDGLALRVLVAGDHDGSTPPLLLCGGIGAAIELWEPFRAALRGYPTVAFDAPGVAESTVPVYPPTMAQIAGTVMRFLDRLGIAEVDVLGVSWGGALAQELAYRHAARVRRLVLCATGAGGLMVPGHPPVLAILATPLRYWSPSYLTQVAPALYGPDIVEDPETLGRQRHIRFARSPSARGYLYQLLALRSFASVLWLHHLRQPTLVLHGDADPIVPPVNGRILAAHIPDARLISLPGAGHLFVLTRAQTVARVVSDFLASR